MKHKTSELTGENLNHAVALAQKWSKSTKFGVPIYIDENGTNTEYCKGYDPEHNWAQCGELVDKFNISQTFEEDDLWSAWITPNDRSNGDIASYASTSKQAICRCVVASVYGDEVEL